MSSAELGSEKFSGFSKVPFSEIFYTTSSSLFFNDFLVTAIFSEVQDYLKYSSHC